jgi:hypothetical protein
MPVHPDPKFRANGSPTPATLAGCDEPVQQWRTSTELTTILDQASDPANLVLYGSAFDADPNDLALLRKHATTREGLGRSLIFRADGSTPGSSQGLGWGGQPGDYSSGFPTAILVKDADELLHIATDFVSTRATPAQVAGATAATRVAHEALLDFDYGETWWASWTNSDDTDVAGAVAMGEHTGDVRVIGFWKVA